MSRRHPRPINIPALTVSMLCFAIIFFLIAVPSTQPQSIIVIAPATTPPCPTDSTWNPITQQCEAIGPPPPATTPSCPTDSTWNPITQQCEAIGPPPPYGTPTWYMPLVLLMFAAVGIILLPKALGLA